MASLLAVGAACGSVKDSGGPIDAGGDAGPDADETGMATVVTEAALFGGTVGANVGNIDIVSMLPNNTVLETKKTDAGGTTTIKVYPGGTVTAIYKHTVDMGADLITFMDVKPNDTLTFGSRNFSTQGHPNTSLGSMTYSWPAQVGAQFYEVYSTCTTPGVSAPTLSVAGTESSACHREPMDLLFMVFSAGGYSHFSFRSNQTFMSGGAIANTSWQALQSATVNVSGLPTEVNSLNGSFTTVIDGTREIGFGSYSGTPTGGAFTANFMTAPTGERSIGRLNLFRQGGFNNAVVADAFAASTLTQTVAAPTLTPWLQGVVGSAALRMASWFMVSETGAAHDGLVARFNWSHTVAAVQQPHQWHVIMPPNTQALVLPKLPAQFTDNVPFAQDNLSVSVRVFDISSLNSYDMVRAQASRNIMCIDCALRGGDFTRAVTSGTVQ